MLAIIGGSGLNQMAALNITHREVMRTPYGAPSAPLLFGELSGEPVVFLARHGNGHRFPPHQINYRANIWALAQQRVNRIIAVAAVGSLNEEHAPGHLVIPTQLIDYTWGRASTFFDNDEMPVTHIDFTHPFCPHLTDRIVSAAETAEIKVHVGGTYAVTQGPRLETAAEIQRLARDGADLVGMTLMPEAALAREKGMAYAALTVVANWAAGKGNSTEKIDLKRAEGILLDGMEKVERILSAKCSQHRSTLFKG